MSETETKPSKAKPKVRQCSRCGEKNPYEVSECWACHALLNVGAGVAMRLCPKCHDTNFPEAFVCRNCYAELEPIRTNEHIGVERRSDIRLGFLVALTMLAGYEYFPWWGLIVAWLGTSTFFWRQTKPKPFSKILSPLTRAGTTDATIDLRWTYLTELFMGHRYCDPPKALADTIIHLAIREGVSELQWIPFPGAISFYKIIDNKRSLMIRGPKASMRDLIDIFEGYSSFETPAGDVYLLQTSVDATQYGRRVVIKLNRISPVIDHSEEKRLADRIIEDAMAKNATVIYCEPEGIISRVKYQIGDKIEQGMGINDYYREAVSTFLENYRIDELPGGDCYELQCDVEQTEYGKRLTIHLSKN